MVVTCKFGSCGPRLSHSLNPRPIRSDPPIIRQGPANQTLAPGTTAQLQCHVMGNPLPSVQWERDGQRILGNDERISLMENGTLQITALQVLQSRQCLSEHTRVCFSAYTAFILQNANTRWVLTYGYFKSSPLQHAPSQAALFPERQHMQSMIFLTNRFPDTHHTPGHIFRHA